MFQPQDTRAVELKGCAQVGVDRHIGKMEARVDGVEVGDMQIWQELIYHLALYSAS